MKKLLTLVLMITYLASAIEFSFSFHYCGGSFKEICFTSDTEKNCCGTKEKSAGCCSDKVVKAKFKDDQTVFAKSVSSKVLVVHGVLPPAIPSLACNISQGYPIYISSDPSPPVTRTIPIYLKNRVFRI
jgi:hypothetical protein